MADSALASESLLQQDDVDTASRGSSADAPAGGTPAVPTPPWAALATRCGCRRGGGGCVQRVLDDVKASSSSSRSSSGAAAEADAAGPGLAITALEALLILPFSGLWAWVWQLPICGLLFRCGCTFSWRGGVSNCNINNPSGPKCPWCNAANTALASVSFLISGHTSMVVMAAAWLALFLRHRRSWKEEALAASTVSATAGTSGEQQATAAAGAAAPPARTAAGFTSLTHAGRRYAGAIGAFLLWCLAMALLWKFGDGTVSPQSASNRIASIPFIIPHHTLT
jgi:hypothetical protein